MMISKKTKEYKDMKEIAISLVPKREGTVAREGLYFLLSKIDKIINFNHNESTYRYDFNNGILQKIPNIYGIKSQTYMKNLNKVFQVYADVKTSAKFLDVVSVKDKNDRLLELVNLTNDSDFVQYCTKSVYTGELMLAKNFFNHAGLSHGGESNRVNKQGISNFRNNGELTPWLRNNPTARRLLEDGVTILDGVIDELDEIIEDIEPTDEELKQIEASIKTR